MCFFVARGEATLQWIVAEENDLGSVQSGSVKVRCEVVLVKSQNILLIAYMAAPMTPPFSPSFAGTTSILVKG